MSGIARRVSGTVFLGMALGAGGVGSAGGQEGLLGPGAAYVGIGVSGVSTDALDERLAARGYPTFGGMPAAVSLGAHRVLRSGVMLGGEWHGLVWGEESHAGREVGLGGGYGTLGLAYAVDLSPRARVYPRLGLGAGGMGLWIETEGVPVGFDEVLADPDREAGFERHTVLSRAGFVMDLGAGAELLPGGRGRGALIGVRLGYLAAPFDGDWRLDRDFADAPVSGGPGGTIAGPYIRFTVGGAWSR